MVSLVTTCPNTKLLQSHWPHSLCCLLHPMAYCVSKWCFVLLNLLCLFGLITTTSSPPEAAHVFSFFFFSFIFISWRLITLQYCSGFCHTLTWISHGFTCVPHPDPPSHLPLYLIPLHPIVFCESVFILFCLYAFFFRFYVQDHMVVVFLYLTYST